MSVDKDVCSEWPLTVTYEYVETSEKVSENQLISTVETASQITTRDEIKWCKNGLRPKQNILMKSRYLWTTETSALKSRVIMYKGMICLVTACLFCQHIKYN
jgi:hypothetical protein